MKIKEFLKPKTKGDKIILGIAIVWGLLTALGQLVNKVTLGETIYLIPAFLGTLVSIFILYVIIKIIKTLVLKYIKK